MGVFNCSMTFLMCFLFKILGSPSQHPFPIIRNSQGSILYHQWARFLNRSSSLLPNSNPLNQLKSLVQTAKSLYRRDRQRISEKDQLTSSVLPPASLPSLISVLQRNAMGHVKSKLYLSIWFHMIGYWQYEFVSWMYLESCRRFMDRIDAQVSSSLCSLSYPSICQSCGSFVLYLLLAGK